MAPCTRYISDCRYYCDDKVPFVSDRWKAIFRWRVVIDLSNHETDLIPHLFHLQIIVIGMAAVEGTRAL